MFSFFPGVFIWVHFNLHENIHTIRSSENDSYVNELFKILNSNFRQMEEKWQGIKTLQEHFQYGNWSQVVYFSAEH